MLSEALERREGLVARLTAGEDWYALHDEVMAEYLYDPDDEVAATLLDFLCGWCRPDLSLSHFAATG